MGLMQGKCVPRRPQRRGRLFWGSGSLPFPLCHLRAMCSNVWGQDAGEAGHQKARF